MSEVKHRVMRDPDGKFVPVVEFHHEPCETEQEALSYLEEANQYREAPSTAAKTHVCDKSSTRAIIEALRFYADPGIYTGLYDDVDGERVEVERPQISDDCGRRAREAVAMLLGREV